MLSFSVRASFWIVTAKQLLLIKLYIFGLCVYCNKKCLPCIISSVNFTFQRRAQVKFAMTYRSVHRVSQQFAGSIVVRPTDWKWIDIAFITESLNSFSLTLVRLSVISVWHDLIHQYHTCHVFWGGTLAADSLSLMDWNQSDISDPAQWTNHMRPLHLLI